MTKAIAPSVRKCSVEGVAAKGVDAEGRAPVRTHVIPTLKIKGTQTHGHL